MRRPTWTGVSRCIHETATLLAYLYLLRVPILIAALLAGLPLVLLSPLRPLVQSLFVLDAWGVFWVMVAALMVAWSVLVSGRVILLNGRERFGIDQWGQDVLTGRQVRLASATVAPLWVCALYLRTEADQVSSAVVWIAASVVGYAVAFFLGFTALVLAVLLSPKYTQPARHRFATLSGLMARILDAAENISVLPAGLSDRVGKWVLRDVPLDLRAGYSDPHTGKLYPGHWLVLTLFTLSVLLYFGLRALTQLDVIGISSIPPIVYVLVGLLVLTFLLSMVAFFLDRYRVPLIVPTLVVCAIGNLFPQSDHFFAVRSDRSIQPVSPKKILASRTDRCRANADGPGRIVVVAAAGGGIQAAAWTAKVLTGLHERVGAAVGTNFADSVALISGVSGGGVGAMFFANAYEADGRAPGFHADAARLRQIVDMAEAPALSEVAWSLIYAEPGRVFLPFIPLSGESRFLDRGYLLQKVWQQKGGVNDTLAGWRIGVEDGWRPAVIFNATIAETGEPFLLATSDLPNATNDATARQTFAGLYPDFDLPVVTAARLAATFPYVSPAARVFSARNEHHILDGGYYDNYGVASVVAWLDDALEKMGRHQRPDVLVIEIRAFKTGKRVDAKPKGWFYQTYAPLEGLLSVRVAAQSVRDGDELDMLRDKWWAEDGVTIRRAAFEFPEAVAPLSWQMTRGEREAIETGWKELFDSGGPADWEVVRSFLDCGRPLSEVPAAPR